MSPSSYHYTKRSHDRPAKLRNSRNMRVSDIWFSKVTQHHRVVQMRLQTEEPFMLDQVSGDVVQQEQVT